MGQVVLHQRHTKFVKEIGNIKRVIYLRLGYSVNLFSNSSSKLNIDEVMYKVGYGKK